MSMSPWTVLVHMAWLPPLFIVFIKMYRGRYPVGASLLAYFIGGLMVLPAVALEQFWHAFVPHDRLVELIEMPLWFVPVEEGSKLFGALLAAKALGFEPPRRSFLFIAIASALGFAVAETGFALAAFGAETLPIRTLISVPAHVVFTLFAAAGLVGKPAAPLHLTAFLGWWCLATGAHISYDVVALYHPDANALDLFVWQAALSGAAVLLAIARLLQRRVVAHVTRAVPHAQ